MRKYYLFYIDNDIKNLLKKDNYYLFNTLYKIYKGQLNNINYNYVVFNDLVKTINKNYINTKLNEQYHDSLIYTRFNNKHTYNDYFLKESSELYVYNKYIKIVSNKNYPTFLKLFSNNYFVCDFDNLDYFWAN